MKYQTRIKCGAIALIIGAFVSLFWLQMNTPVVYEGVGEGFDSEIKVQVTAYRNGKNEIRMTDIQVQHGDSEGIAGPAISALVEKIKNKQTTEIELVAGATYTSEGLLEAIKDAISKIPEK